LAIIGLWDLIKDISAWLLRPHLVEKPSTSLMIIVRDREQEIEGLVRFLLGEITQESFLDVIVVDVGSVDLTAAILDRLADRYPILQVLHISCEERPVAAAMPLCRGSVVHVLDLNTRLSADEFMIMVSSLAK
jgi:hypothetical protein